MTSGSSGERSGAAVLQRMAIEEPAKFAQLAAGPIPKEALLTVAQRLPGNLEGEDWELMLSVCAAIKQALPGANERSPSEVLSFVLDAIRQADAKLIDCLFDQSRKGKAVDYG